MAQRSPIRSFLSVVPSKKSESGESPKRVRKSKASSKRQPKSKSRTKPSGAISEPTRSRQSNVQETGPSIPDFSRRPNGRGSGGEGNPRQRSPLSPQQQQSQQIADRVRNGLSGRSSTPNSLDLLAQQQQTAFTPSTPLSRQLSDPKPTAPMARTPQRNSPQEKPIAPKRSLKPPAKRNPAGTKAKPANPKRRQRNPTPRQPQRHKISPLVYAARLLIVGVGLGVLAGTILSVWNPANNYSANNSGTAQAEEQQETEGTTDVASTLAVGSFPVTQELGVLKAQLQKMAAENAELTPGVYAIELDTGAYLDLNGTLSFSAASTIKVPILIAFFQDVDAGKISLDDVLTMKAEQIAEGSGEMQYSEPGTQYTALETVTKMITISDNTATNMLIERLGGAAVLNQRFASWGLKSTAIANPLPDLEGTNTISPQDLVQLIAKVERGGLVSLRSRDRLLNIMQQTVNNSLLPQGLGSGAAIAHKTGDIGSTIADAGLVDMPNGKRYAIAILVKRPHNDPTAEELIRQMSGVVYKYFNGEGEGTGNGEPVTGGEG